MRRRSSGGCGRLVGGLSGGDEGGAEEGGEGRCTPPDWIVPAETEGRGARERRRAG